MKNPWLANEYGKGAAYCDVESRIRLVKEASTKKLKEMINWPDTQKTVRVAAERRLRKITVRGEG
ncbi:MAG: hypothetical protein GY774_16420 [Planctomycetes bacterium]|nr:hypothetical protein [Planctomycetota bacterium]